MEIGNKTTFKHFRLKLLLRSRIYLLHSVQTVMTFLPQCYDKRVERNWLIYAQNPRVTTRCSGLVA